MFIILSLIIIVAAFNIISGFTILVKNKTKEIAILKSIGVLNKSITKIFFLIGFYIGTTATIFGITIGVLFSVYIENIRTFLSDIFKIPLFPAIASCFWQILKSSCDFFLSFLPMLSRRSFILVLNFREILLFLKNLVLSCLTLFLADFVIGIN